MLCSGGSANVTVALHTHKVSTHLQNVNHFSVTCETLINFEVIHLLPWQKIMCRLLWKITIAESLSCMNHDMLDRFMLLA